MKINVLGWYGMNNVGDEVFRHVFCELLAGHELRFVTPPSSCDDCDVVVLGGGAVVSPFYLERLPSGNYDLYAVGVDLAYETEADLLKGLPIRGAVMRNRADLARMPCHAEYAPDLAFLMRPSGADVLSRYKKTAKKTVGVFATDYVNPAIDRPVNEFSGRAASFKTGMAKELDLLAAAGYEVILVPCATGGYGDDRRINLDIAAFMKGKPTLVFDTLSPQEMIDLIAGLDAAVCMRYHSHIFCVVAGTPFVSVEYTRKVRCFLSENGIDSVTACTWAGSTFVADGLAGRVASSKTVISADPLHAEVAAVTDRFVNRWLRGESPACHRRSV